MKELILVRHATAQSQTDENDLSRKLVSKGHAESQNIASLLAKLQIKIDLIVTSHADRAVETADHIQKIAYRTFYRLVENTLYSGEKSDYLATINQLKDSCNSVLLIGHNPVIEEVAAYFVNSEGPTITFPKASVYVFTIDCDSWKDVENKNSQLTCFIKRGDIQKLLKQPDDKKILDALKNQYSTTQKLFKRVKKEGFKKGLTHDIRINNRRWLSLMALSGCESEALQTSINAFMKSTGKYRDLCVQTKILKKDNDESSIYDFWKKKKFKFKKKLSKTLSKEIKKDLLALYKAYYNMITAEKDRLSEIELRTDIQSSLEQLKISSEITPEGNKTEWHEFRLKAKALRYKIEYFREAYACKDYEAELDKLIFLQQNLGKLRDYEKLMTKISKQSKSFKNEEIQNTVQNIQKRFQEKWSEISDFLENYPSYTLSLNDRKVE